MLERSDHATSQHYGALPVILAEPPRTNYDLHFKIADIPVRIHPWFWFIGILLGISNPDTRPVEVLIWLLAMLVSILVHELGHAVAIRHFGWSPRIVLYSLGGLAIYDPSQSYSYSYNEHEDNPKVKILIAAAGPIAGFLLAAVLIGLIWATGNEVRFGWGGPLGFYWQVTGLDSAKTHLLINDLIFINIFWGLVNLLPVFPLDGGQISRELFTWSNPYDGVVKSLWLSAITGGVMAVLGLVRLGFRDGLFIALLFGYLAYISYATLQAYRGGGYGGYGSSSEDRPW
jgi:Zn-dependent protease